MDIEDIVKQLEPIASEHGELDAEGVAEASGLLALPRYTQAKGNPYVLLLADLKTAVARLPKGVYELHGPCDVRGDARAVLITRPGDNTEDRYAKYLSSSTRNGGARKWQRHFLLSRVARELLEIYRAQGDGLVSYRILSLNLGVNVTYQGEEQHRDTSFEWSIQSMVADMRWFGFRHNVHDMTVKWECLSDGHTPIGRVPVRSKGEDGDHWYVVSLGKPLPLDKPVTIKVVSHATGPRTNFPWLSYTLELPVGTLALTAEAPADEATSFVCQERNGPDLLSEDSYPRDPGAPMRYEPPSPQKGRTYRIDWNG